MHVAACPKLLFMDIGKYNELPIWISLITDNGNYLPISVNRITDIGKSSCFMDIGNSIYRYRKLELPISVIRITDNDK